MKFPGCYEHSENNVTTVAFPTFTFDATTNNKIEFFTTLACSGDTVLTPTPIIHTFTIQFNLPITYSFQSVNHIYCSNPSITSHQIRKKFKIEQEACVLARVCMRRKLKENGKEGELEGMRLKLFDYTSKIYSPSANTTRILKKRLPESKG